MIFRIFRKNSHFEAWLSKWLFSIDMSKITYRMDSGKLEKKLQKLEIKSGIGGHKPRPDVYKMEH